MPKGKPKAGFRRTKRYKTKSLQELERDIANKAPDIVEELEKLTKPFPCPHCGNEIRIIDKDVGIYLVDRALGKPKQRQEVDITQNIQLSADDIDRIIQDKCGVSLEDIQRYMMDQKRLLPEVTPGNTETNEN